MKQENHNEKEHAFIAGLLTGVVGVSLTLIFAQIASTLQ